MTGAAWAILAALAVGVGSALFPLLNAEAYFTATLPGTAPATVAGTVAALAAGQTAGKTVLFLSVRRGGRRWAVAQPGRRHLPGWLVRVTTAQLRWLGHPVAGPAVVVSSAAVGLPPLLAVAAAAGAASTRLPVFVLACLAGRTLRFSALALGLAVLIR